MACTAARWRPRARPRWPPPPPSPSCPPGCAARPEQRHKTTPKPPGSALEYVPADRLMINPDCGLRHLAPEVARQTLRAMVAGVAQVPAELAGRSPPAPF